MIGTTSLLDAVTRRVDAAHELGVELGEPIGRVTLTDDGHWVDIGVVIVYPSGAIEVAPHTDCTAEQALSVLAHGERARLDGPVGSHWTRVRDIGWATSIFEAVEVDA